MARLGPGTGQKVRSRPPRSRARTTGSTLTFRPMAKGVQATTQRLFPTPQIVEIKEQSAVPDIDGGILPTVEDADEGPRMALPSRQMRVAPSGGRRQATVSTSPEALTQWQAMMNAHLGPAAVKDAAEDESPIPIARAQEMKSEAMKIEPQLVRSGDRMVLVGSELMGQVSIYGTVAGTPTSIPQGGVYSAVPLNPILNDGMRVAKFMEAFDQWALRRVMIEYVPMTNAVAALGGLVMVVSNDPADLLGVESGWSALRDAMSRPGAATFNVYANAMAGQNQPLLKWYFTGQPQEVDWMLPGTAYVLAATSQQNATGTDVPLGLLWMHYEIELRSPSLNKSSPQMFATAPFSFVWTNCVTGIHLAVSVPDASAGLPTSHRKNGVIGWGTIAAADDAAWGSAAWRTFVHPTTGQGVTLGPGNLVYWRYFQNGATTGVAVFVTLEDAFSFEPISLERDLITTVAQVGGTVRGFKVVNVNGTEIPSF